MIIENGKPYPDPKFKGREGATILTNEAFFDVLILNPGITAKEEKAFKTGALRYGMFEKNDVPFLLLDFPDADLTLDAPFSIHKLFEEVQEKWVEAEGNACHIVGVEQRSYYVKSQRFVGFNLEFVSAFRTVAARQLRSHPNAQSVDLATQRILHSLTTADMMKAAKMYRL